MSLTKCPSCKHQNSWFRVYMALNLKHRFSGKIIRCENCKKKLILERVKKEKLSEKIWSGVVWTFIPMLLIVLVTLGELDYKTAILAVIIYHFACFVGIIGMMQYCRVEK